MNLNNKKNISKAILVLPIIGILISSFIITLISVFSIKKAFEKQKQETTERFMQNLKTTTKEKVNLAYVIVDALYKENLKIYKDKVKAKQITFKEFPNFFDKFRWSRKGYIFMFSIKDKGVTVYHINHKFMKINRWNLVRHGQKIIQIITNGAIAHPEGTYVKYLAYNPDGKAEDKISYVKVYKPLDILISAGVYLNYLDKDLLNIQKEEHNLLISLIEKIIFVSLLSLILMIFIISILSKKLQILFIQNQNELEKEKENFKKKAYFDTLTNLYTRYGAEKEFEKIKKNIDSNNKKTAILFVDLDHFKDINDSLGHNIGDEVLKIIANRLKKSVTFKDKVVRFGGDEFVIILNEIENEVEVTKLIEKILIIIKYAININNREFYISASIGVTIYPDDSNDFETLIKFADSAMYQAKKMGKDRYMFFKKEIAKAADEKLNLKNEIRKAIEKNEFEIYFQPQIDKFAKTYGAEVLIRWNHYEKGIISPFFFIPLAIESGIIDKIDLWVIESAIKQHLEWQKKGYYPILSCNVTVYQLEKGLFAQNLKNLLQKYNFDA